MTPRTLSGFRDYLPDVMLAREKVLDTARRVYRSYGFTPIDTPACESLDVLLGKGGDESDKLVYRVLSARGDKAEMGLRFDLTVPFARFSAQHINQLGTPFKRYAMGPVWRGERPGHGRYREFWQCDFDTIGTISNAADIETVLVINDLFTAIGFEKFEIRINNRNLLNAFLITLGLGGESVAVLRALDKLHKIGREDVIKEMLATTSGGDDATFGWVLDLVGMSDNETDNFAILKKIDDLFRTGKLRGDNPEAALQALEKGSQSLQELLAVANTAGIPEGRIKIDLSIARGLDYYTGTIYETFLTDPISVQSGIGSVCSGGRYDNLASKYTKQVLPGVGASLGLDRLITAMEKLKHPLLTGRTSPSDVLIVNFESWLFGCCSSIAIFLRSYGLNVEIYPDSIPLGKQLKYASRIGCNFAIMIGAEEAGKGAFKIKNLITREEKLFTCIGDEGTEQAKTAVAMLTSDRVLLSEQQSGVFQDRFITMAEEALSRKLG